MKNVISTYQEATQQEAEWGKKFLEFLADMDVAQ